jgi:hypothetical protein
VSTKDAFTLLENNSGWTNSEIIVPLHPSRSLTSLRWMGIFVGIYGADVDPHWLWVVFVSVVSLL